MKVSVKKYLLYTSVFGIFTELFFVNFIIDIKLIYLIIITNYFLLYKITTLKINLIFILLISFILLHGLFINLVLGITPNYLLSQVIGITIVSTYYYNFLSLYNTKEVVAVYLKIATVIVILGYIMYFFDLQSYENRFHSIFKEPAHFVVVVLPACYYFLKTKKLLLFFLFLFSFILSKSSLGFIGCIFVLIIPLMSIKRTLVLIAMIPVVIFIGKLSYENSEDLKLRIDDTYNSLLAINTGKFKPDTNLSSYAILSNFFVAKSNFIDHPFGSGLGSHTYMHKNIYLNQMNPPAYIKTLKLDDINSSDANSLFLRLFSDLGIFGLFIVILLIYYGFKSFGENNYLIISQGIFIYILLKLIRDGHYFSPELYFFIWLMYYNYKESITKSNFGKIL